MFCPTGKCEKTMFDQLKVDVPWVHRSRKSTVLGRIINVKLEFRLSCLFFVPCRFARFVLEQFFFVKTIVDRWNFPLNHDGRNGTPSLIQSTFGIYSLKYGIFN